MTRRVALIGLLVFFLGLGGVFVAFRNKQQGADLSAHGTMQQALSQLEERSGDHPAMKLKSGLVPPTNKWFSGAVFGDNVQPIFAYPLSYKFSKDSLEIGYPQITGTADAVFGTHIKSIGVQMQGANRYEVSYYDDLLIMLTYYAQNNQPLAEVTIARGSPYVYITASQNTQIATTANGIRKDSDKIVGQGPGKSLVGVYAETPATVTNSSATFSLTKGKLLSVFIAPDVSQKDAFFAAAPNALQKITTSYKVNDGTVETTLAAQTRNSKDTLYTFQPGDEPQGSSSIATYQSLQGPLKVIKGKTFSIITTRPKMAGLKLNMLSVAEKDDVKAKLTADVNTLAITKTDTYFGGKELYRAATLLSLAGQLGMTAEKQKVQAQLKEAMHGWLMNAKDSPRAKKYFYYDTTIKSVIGEEPSFGSEELNDHHFHYGYFIYAASVLGKYDQSFVQQDGPMINLLVEDIASETNGPALARLRNFDVWTGHSYASGYGMFGDGNNQESSSEALQAWGGVMQWADVTKNDVLRDRAVWLYSRESRAALQDWFIANNTQLPYSGYNHKLVSLVWDGKRDYATFFSPRPQAKLGIQLIPMSNAQSYLKTMSKSDVETYIREAAPTDAELNGQFGDYILMFMAQADKERAKALLPTLTSATALDDGNSLSYLTAWVYAGGLQ